MLSAVIRDANAATARAGASSSAAAAKTSDASAVQEHARARRGRSRRPPPPPPNSEDVTKPSALASNRAASCDASASASEARSHAPTRERRAARRLRRRRRRRTRSTRAPPAGRSRSCIAPSAGTSWSRTEPRPLTATRTLPRREAARACRPPSRREIAVAEETFDATRVKASDGSGTSVGSVTSSPMATSPTLTAGCDASSADWANEKLAVAALGGTRTVIRHQFVQTPRAAWAQGQSVLCARTPETVVAAAAVRSHCTPLASGGAPPRARRRWSPAPSARRSPPGRCGGRRRDHSRR